MIPWPWIKKPPIYVDHLKPEINIDKVEISKLPVIPEWSGIRLLPAGLPCKRCRGSGVELELQPISMAHRPRPYQRGDDFTALSNYWHDFLNGPWHERTMDHEVPDL